MLHDYIWVVLVYPCIDKAHLQLPLLVILGQRVQPARPALYKRNVQFNFKK